MVAPPQSERATILSVSAEARREGIFKGMALGTAKKFCPELSVLPPNPGLMERGCKALSKSVSEYTPLWEPARPGHIYMDVTGTERLWGRAKDTASRIRCEIKRQLSLTGTVGVSGNKMVSSIASRLIFREGVMDVDHESAFMAPLKVDYLPGIGLVRRRILLEELNISLVREIAVMDLGNLRLVFGRQSYVIQQRALGIDPTPVHPPIAKPTISEAITLPSDENDDRKLLGTLYSLVEKCSRKLRARRLFPLRAGLLIRYADQLEVTRQVRLKGVGIMDMDLYTPLEEQFFKACQRRTGVRFMRIWFREFSTPPAQLSLFPIKSSKAKKPLQLTKALDHIREKYGDMGIEYGRVA